ncbi:MAG: YbhB/YbcL family Raf kinase inhibitor-like protein [Candidatus Eremiobacteraeota bacterium]|nr:YbhB/YbcL family Raf kinase inhibitor-like protein [Candidatus Eremiobacteraeota bacterium]
MATLTLTSSTFRDGQTIPMSAVFNRMGCTGQDLSPDISWSNAPSNAKSYAITLWDPDVPTGVGFVHWVLFNIPGNVTSLKTGDGSKADAGVGATHGFTDYGFARYGGPCPGPGEAPHHYHLTVYAFDVERFDDFDETTTYAKFRYFTAPHLLATGEIVGLFGR